jgi:hypothetical protein
MSTSTLTPPGDFGDWGDFLEFAAITRGFERDVLPEPDADVPPLEHRRARGADRRAAIDKSLKEG